MLHNSSVCVLHSAVDRRQAVTLFIDGVSSRERDSQDMDFMKNTPSAVQ